MSIPSSTVTTNTYSFNISAGDTVLYAFSLCGIRRTELQQTHLIDAAIAFNMAMVNLTNHIPLRFTLETEIIPLTANVAGYNLTDRTVGVPIVTILSTPPGTVPNSVYANYGKVVTDSEGNEIVLDVGGVTSANNNYIERVLGLISAFEYRAMPNKSQQAPPTAYWFNLASQPTITFWPTPDSSFQYFAIVQTFRQLQDVDLTNAQSIDSPYRFLDALATEVAARLADSYKPEKSAMLYALAEKRLNSAITRDQESVNISINPGISSYYRIN